MSAHDYLCHATARLKEAEFWIDSARNYTFNEVDDEHAARLAVRARNLADRLEELSKRNAA